MCVLRLSAITRLAVADVPVAKQACQEAGVVLLGAGVADGANDFAADHVEGRYQRLGAVTDIFELASGDLARVRRKARRGAFERLHAGHFVN